MASMLKILAQSIVLGFSIAAPVGPIGVLCIRRSLQKGFRSGLASGLGAASADEVPLTTLRDETRRLLRHEAVLDPSEAKDASAVALCDLYVVLRNDTRYKTSAMLQGDAAKIRRRLLSIAKRNENRLKRANVSRPGNLGTDLDAAIRAAMSEDSASLASQAPLEGHAGASLLDNGWQLVELIQRVVSPSFWDRQGGPGTMRYFAMRRVLVVRATTDVHEQIRDLLMALR